MTAMKRGIPNHSDGDRPGASDHTLASGEHQGESAFLAVPVPRDSQPTAATTLQALAGEAGVSG